MQCPTVQKSFEGRARAVCPWTWTSSRPLSSYMSSTHWQWMSVVTVIFPPLLSQHPLHAGSHNSFPADFGCWCQSSLDWAVVVDSLQYKTPLSSAKTIFHRGDYSYPAVHATRTLHRPLFTCPLLLCTQILPDESMRSRHVQGMACSSIYCIIKMYFTSLSNTISGCGYQSRGLISTDSCTREHTAPSI